MLWQHRSIILINHVSDFLSRLLILYNLIYPINKKVENVAGLEFLVDYHNIVFGLEDEIVL